MLQKYLDGQPISVAEIKAAARSACLKSKIVPTFCGTAFKNKGIQPLLDAVIAYLPSPLDKPPAKGVKTTW